VSPRRLHPDEAAALLRASDVLAVPLGPGHPIGFLHALGERDDWVDLRISGALLTDLYQVLLHPGVSFTSGFFGPAERFLRDSGGRIEFVPADFRRFAPLLEQLHPRVMATAAAPPDASGFCSLSLHAGATVDELHRVGRDPDRLLVVEVSPRYPRTHGLPPEHNHALHLDEIDVLVETDRGPVELAEEQPTDADRAIAEHVAAFVPDGATLQTGIGAIPSMVATMLAEGGGGDYGVHSEMFTTGLMRLHAAGKVTNRRKGQLQGASIATFAAGSRALYDWLDGNAGVRFLPVDLVNSAELIARNRHMVSINGALAVDLWGQVVADTIGLKQYSGIGGHEDFVAGPGLHLEDRSLLCLPSTVAVGGEVRSRIVATLPAGSVVTTPRHQLDVVVTEWGAAELSGGTVRQRALALAAIAHPDSRDELREHAARLG
jgi:acyl-CoA hydrolase